MNVASFALKRRSNRSSKARFAGKALAALLVLGLSLGSGIGQGLSSDFRTISVGKKIGEFPDVFDLSSPLSACISFDYLRLKGRESQLGQVSSLRIRGYFAGPGQPDSVVSDQKRAAILNTLVNEVIVFKDSVAAVISRPSEDYYSVRYMSCEGGQWLNAGEDMGMTLEDSRRVFGEKAGLFADFAKRIPVLARVPTDFAPFTEYLKTNARDPKTFVLEALARHRLVIYGEIHRRRWSWDFCRSVIDDKTFPESTGTVYMEISAHKQDDLDAFLAKESPAPELILGIFREMQSQGWPDKGMYEFLLDVWRLNRTLPAAKRIRIVAVDIPRPFSTLRTPEEQKAFFDTVMNRNAFMAEAVEKDIRSNKDPRHGLFIVGTGHAYRSSPPGFASSASATTIPSAGALLSSRLPRGEVYTVFTHQAIVDNSGNIQGRLRGGAFDGAFAMNGDTPVAFAVPGSPFGREPFDALPEISYRTAAGTYADNYDGYVFLGPLAGEPADYILYELYSADFVKEMARRAGLDHATLREWFGVEEATPEAIIAKIGKSTEGKKRWEGLPPLKTALLSLAANNPRVQLTLDTSEADAVLDILALRREKKPVDEARWQALFVTEPYRRLKLREKKIGEQFKNPALAFSDEDFKKFVLSEDLLKREARLRTTIEQWKKVDVNGLAESDLQYLPDRAVIRAKIFPAIKPRVNSFVWEPSTDPAIFLYLDPEVNRAKFENTVAHELHHIGLASVESGYNAKIAVLPERARAAAEWMGAFGEGFAMLAAAGGTDVHPHAVSSADERARWDRDMANFSADLKTVDGFFRDVLNGKFADREAIDEKGSAFYGVQGPWYTVGYKMAVIVEKRFGRPALIETMLDPRELLVLYDRAAAERNAAGTDDLPLWSDETLEQVGAAPRK
jgi:hypothetical protein